MVQHPREPTAVVWPLTRKPTQMNTPMTVRPVETAADRKAFVEVAFRLNAGNPALWTVVLSAAE